MRVPPPPCRTLGLPCRLQEVKEETDTPLRVLESCPGPGGSGQDSREGPPKDSAQEGPELRKIWFRSSFCTPLPPIPGICSGLWLLSSAPKSIFSAAKRGLEVTASQGCAGSAPGSTNLLWLRAQHVPGWVPGRGISPPPGEIGRVLTPWRAQSGEKSDRCSDVHEIKGAHHRCPEEGPGGVAELVRG